MRLKRFIWLYPATGLVVGLIAWNDKQAYMPVSLLILPAWYYAQNLLIAFLTVFFYFAAASHGLPVGTMTYLQTNFFNASFTWLTGVFLVSLPFVLLFNNKKLRIIGLYIALFADVIPPFGLTCWTHPLASTGMWWPAGGWLALAAVLLLVPAFCRWPVLLTGPVLLALFLSYKPAASTHIPDIQHNIMAAWSQLFAVPLLTATNL